MLASVDFSQRRASLEPYKQKIAVAFGSVDVCKKALPAAAIIGVRVPSPLIEQRRRVDS